MKILLFSSLFWACSFAVYGKGLNLLHLTFHQGCAKEIEAVSEALGNKVTTWWIPSLPPLFLDGQTRGNALYNIGYDRAERIWKLHRETFEQYDAIITSDTAPLARIFLQNGYTKPLIIWICCRFDYSDQESLDCDFPDRKYYELFDRAYLEKNVTVIAYTPFEHYYAQKKGVDTGNLVITPCAPGSKLNETDSLIPARIEKDKTFFIPPYWNETRFIDLSDLCERLNIPSYCGKYNGCLDLKGFKGIIHLPYAWSNLSFFENLSLEIPYFIPSKDFLKKLLHENNYWHTEPTVLINEERFEFSEWYQPGREEIITYFDSWEDLNVKIEKADFHALKTKIGTYGKKYQEEMLQRWVKVFEDKKDPL